MDRGRRKLLSFALGVLISVVLLWLLFREIEFAELIEALKEARYLWLLPNIALIIFSMYQRAYRWDFMVRPVKKVRFSNLLAATCIGFMANNVLPLRLGEFVRAYSLAWQDRGISKSASLATIFVERMVFDLVALLLILGVVISVTAVDIMGQMRMGIYICILVALLGLTFVTIMALKPSQAGSFLTRYLFFLPARMKDQVRAIVMKFSNGLEFIKHGRTVASVSFQTVLIWLSMGLSNYFVFVAFDFDLPLDASFFLLVVVSISILIPSSPGFVGVYHAGAVFALQQYGIGREAALSFALVLHAAQYIPITVMGFYYLKKEHLSLRRLEEEAKTMSE